MDALSSDRTREIAASFGARVAERAWTDDYAAARNAAVELARGDWILCIDADERLLQPKGLRALIERAPGQVGGYWLERHDRVLLPDSGKLEVYPVANLRLFRRHPGIRFRGIVHERVQDSVADAGFETRIATTVQLTHRVCDRSPEVLEAKQRRYLALLDRALAQDPSDFWSLYYRGKTLWYLKRPGDAEADLRSVAERSGRLQLRASARCLLAALALEHGRHDQALDELRLSLELVPEQSFAYSVQAEVLYALGRFEEAEASYMKVRLALDPEVPAGHVHADLYMTRPNRAFKLGCCALARAKPAEAARRFREGLRHDPQDASCLYGLAQAFLLGGDQAKARELAALSLAACPTWTLARQLVASLAPEASPK